MDRGQDHLAPIPDPAGVDRAHVAAGVEGVGGKLNKEITKMITGIYLYLSEGKARFQPEYGGEDEWRNNLAHEDPNTITWLLANISSGKFKMDFPVPWLQSQGARLNPGETLGYWLGLRTDNGNLKATIKLIANLEEITGISPEMVKELFQEAGIICEIQEWYNLKPYSTWKGLGGTGVRRG